MIIFVVAVVVAALVAACVDFVFNIKNNDNGSSHKGCDYKCKGKDKESEYAKIIFN